MTKKYETLGKTIKKLLFDRNIRPADLAREANIPVTTIHRIVTGKSTRPYPSTLEAIAKYFGKTPEELKNESFDKNFLSNMEIRNISLVTWDNIETTVPNSNFSIHNISDVGFALKMNDSSMEPLFPKNCILIFEPKYKNLPDRSYILVRLENTKQQVFRQLIIVDGTKYIQAINPEIKTISLKQLTNQDTILAKLIESRMIQP